MRATSALAGLLFVTTCTAVGRGVGADPVPGDVGTVEGRVRRVGVGERARVEIRRLFDLDAHFEGGDALPITERLLAGPPAWPPVASVETDAEGHYVVGDLPPGVYDATAIAQDASSDWTGFTIPAAGARVEAALNLPSRTRSVEGSVVRQDGSPFRGAVLLTPAWTRSEYEDLAVRARSAETSADGSFRANGVGTDDTDLIAGVAGELRVRTPFPASPPKGRRFVVDEGFVDLRFRVVEDSDGKPVEGVVLVADGETPAGGTALVRGVTDAAGRCALRAIAGLKAGVAAYKPGYGRTSRDALEAGDVEMTLKMARAARLTGRITRAGTPVGGVEVRVLAPEPREEWCLGVARTDARGRYALGDLPPGEAVVLAGGPGLGASKDPRTEDRNRSRVLLEAGKGAVVDLSLVSVPVARGRVLDDAGKPVAGAVVREVNDDQPRRWKSFAEPRRTLAVGVVRADGKFTLDHAVDPASRLEVRAVGHALFLSEPPSVPKEPVGFDLRLPPVRRVAVLVLDDATGTPLVGAAVEVLCWTGASSTSWKGTTGSDGRTVSDPTIHGAYRIGAAQFGYAAGGVGSDPVAEVPERVTIRLKHGAVLAGRVLSANRTPAAGATVSCFFTLPGGYGAQMSAVVGDDGTFRFEDLPPPPQSLELRAQARGAARYNPAVLKTTAGTSDNELVLE